MKKGVPIWLQILWGLLAVVMVVIVGTGVWFWQGSLSREGGWEEKRLEGLQIYGAVPEFGLIERSGRRVELSDLRGKFWVAQFFYTNCPDICPLTVPQMVLLQLDFKDVPGIRYVSITVDPERDTPEVLREFAERFSGDPERWFLLTGEKAAIYRLAQEGFRLGIGEMENPPEEKAKTGEEKAILHSARIILVDRKAQIRGYYSGIEADAMVRLRRDLKALLGSEDVVS